MNDRHSPPTARTLLSSTNMYLVAIILGSLLLIGTFSDYAISESLYDPGAVYGKLFATYGEYPVFMALAASGTLLLMGHNKQDHRYGYAEIGIGSVFLLAALGAAVIIPSDTGFSPFWVRLIVSVTVIGGTAYLTYFASRSADRYMMLRVAIVLIAVIALQLFVVTVVKVLWERPRMRSVVAADAASYRPWYRPGFADKATFMELGVSKEEFKSFPSGHTANAAVLMTLTAFGALNSTLRDKTSLLLWIGFTFAAVVAVSRIVAGAHFLSDTVVGLTVTFVAMAAVYQFFFPQVGPKHVAKREGNVAPR